MKTIKRWLPIGILVAVGVRIRVTDPSGRDRFVFLSPAK
jgi:hypothetical protein